MKYTLKELKVSELVEYIDHERVDLNPEYQRNFIWTPADQKSLVDTLLKSYAMPAFFMYQYDDGALEMVDGQQRSKTIYRFVKGIISSSKELGNLNFETCDQEAILNYKLPFIVISPMKNAKTILREFYVLINKSGKHLNTPEVHKSEYFDKKFMQLSNDALNNQNFVSLNMFTQASRNRMNDRAYVEELLAYLHLGISDKRIAVERLYETDITDEEYSLLKSGFESVIDKIARLNSFYPIKSTRYKQKNDFYTLFNFVHNNISETDEIFIYRYRVLLVLDGSDEDERQFIRPSNEECITLRNYANNCVTQSNSKTARENRLKVFNSILKNQNENGNDDLVDVCDYLESVFEKASVELIKIDKYFLPDVNELEQL